MEAIADHLINNRDFWQESNQIQVLIMHCKYHQFQYRCTCTLRRTPIINIKEPRC
jgi:hypothetical protein